MFALQLQCQRRYVLMAVRGKWEEKKHNTHLASFYFTTYCAMFLMDKNEHSEILFCTLQIVITYTSESTLELDGATELWYIHTLH